MNVEIRKKNTVVIAGKFPFFSTNAGLASGFRKQGLNVVEVALEDFLGEAKSTIQKIKSRIFRRKNIYKYNKEILYCVAKNNPLAFLAVKGSYIYPETLKSIKVLSVLILNYYPDFRFSYKDVDKNAFKYYDMFFTTKSFQVEYLSNLLGSEKVSFLHHGYVSDVHSPPSLMKNFNYECDLSYIGNHTSEKEKWLCEVKKKLPTINLKIYGGRWDHADDILESSIVGVPLYGKDFCQAINSSKINLAVHMGVVDNSGWEDLVSTRTFEIPACKGFMLHIDNVEVRELFTPGEEIDVFKDVNELCEKVKFYLVNDAVREEMVARAYQRCVPAYSYDERARTIADWIRSVQ